jgi:XTP/dITP diphosphohydrolase
MRLLIATSNANKVKEITPVLGGCGVELLTLADVAAVAPPEETGGTFWENARIKALANAKATGLTAVAEDSGLAIDALGGEPGVHSARFLGPDVPYAKRFEEIYRRLAALDSNRNDAPASARFVTALAVASGDTVLFETEAAIEGVIAPRPSGEHGFGYDPIFYYAPLKKTTAQMTLEEKSAVSHRGRAFRDLARWLTSAAR